MCKNRESPFCSLAILTEAHASRTLPDESTSRPLLTPNAVCARRFNISTSSSSPLSAQLSCHSAVGLPRKSTWSETTVVERVARSRAPCGARAASGRAFGVTRALSRALEEQNCSTWHDPYDRQQRYASFCYCRFSSVCH